jgi:esterase/lipase superfamily enzyme
MGIIIGTGEWDNTRHESYRLSEILNAKGIKHWLDDGKWRGHEWSYLARHAPILFVEDLAGR